MPEPMTDERLAEIEANRYAESSEHCEVTGNPCGTDTWMVGRPCQCHACRMWSDEFVRRLQIEHDDLFAEVKRLREENAGLDYLTAQDDEVICGLRAERDQLAAEVERLRSSAHLSEEEGDGPHVRYAHGAEECPSWYDGCHCTVGSMRSVLVEYKRLNAECDRYREALEPIAERVVKLETSYWPHDPPPTVEVLIPLSMLRIARDALASAGEDPKDKP